jgi:putative ABC transport system permease protein
MLRLTLKNLGANKVRFALTTFGVMLAVSFVVSAFVLGDGLRSSFQGVSEDITAGVDLEVRPVSEFGDPEPLSIDMVAIVAAVDGVADAVPSIEAADDAVRPIKADGEGITTDGPPQLAWNWVDNEQLSPFSLVEGAPPGLDEFTMDFASAGEHDFVIGEAYELITPDGRRDLTLSGTSSFGDDNATLGAVLMQMNTAQASEIFGINGIDAVNVQLIESADLAAVQAAVAAAVPGAEVVDHDVVLDETTAEFTDEIDIVGNILLGFGGVALFVSIFIIYNTFAIVLGQRTRELALLRTVGAMPNQIRRSVLGEAFVVGVLASAGGIVGGIGVAKGIDALFGATGVDLPDYPLILANRTLIAAVVIGIGVTMAAAIGPARKASTVPAIAALRGGADASAVGSRTRKISGTGLFATGVAAGALGLSGVGSTAVTVACMALGAIAVFLGVTILSPLAVGVVTKTVGWPMRKSAGVAGQLAQKNAARNPRRTATTAAALMIGLALVSTALIVGQSIKEHIGTTIEDSANADYFVTDQLEEVDFRSTLVAEIQDEESVEAATGFRYVEARVGGNVADVAAAQLDQLPALLDVDVIEGDYTAAVVNPVLVSVDESESLALGVGDTLTTEFSNGSSATATVVGLFDDQAIITADYVFDTAMLDTLGVDQADEWLAVAFSDAVSPSVVEAMVVGWAAEFPHADIETADQFVDRVVGSIDDILAMVNVMVALAVIIALIGIANTLALSVYERTRELGLIRAVGMTRRQLRRMVRFEAALVATFGAVLGVGIGLLFGWGVVTALPESFASSLAIPVGSIVALMVVAAVAGVVAAWLPARRAGRLNVLDAIAH